MGLSNLDKCKESNCLEAKSAQGGIPRSIWETISAFANTGGGMIVLGAKELRDGTLEISGLSDADKMLDDFWNAAHSPDKLYPCVLSDKDVRIEEIEGTQLIVVDVPRADRHLRPVYVNGNPMTGTYRRDHKGDYRCAASEIHAMYRDASDESVDSYVHENLTVSALSAETIASYRTSYGIHHDSHAWTELPTDEFLCRIGAARVGSDGAVHPHQRRPPHVRRRVAHHGGVSTLLPRLQAGARSRRALANAHNVAGRQLVGECFRLLPPCIQQYEAGASGALPPRREQLAHR